MSLRHIVVRPAKSEDLPSMNRNYSQIYIDQLQKNAQLNVAGYVVAECDGVIVGHTSTAFWYPFSFPPTDLRQLYIACVYVFPEYRKKGVGKAMIAHLKQAAIQQQVQVIRLECDPYKLLEYYVAQGFTPLAYPKTESNYADAQQIMELHL